MAEMSRVPTAAPVQLNSLLSSAPSTLETHASLDQAREHCLHGMDLPELK